MRHWITLVLGAATLGSLVWAVITSTRVDAKESEVASLTEQIATLSKRLHAIEPQAARVQELEARIASLTQEPKVVYTAAVSAGTKAELERFIVAFPQEAELVANARQLIERLEREAAAVEQARAAEAERQRLAAEEARKQELARQQAEEKRRKEEERLRGTPAGGGFYYKNVKFKSEYGFTEIIGEMTNLSGDSARGAMFTISMYDRNGSLGGTAPIIINNFPAGATRSFTTMSDDGTSRGTYKIDLDTVF